MEFVGMNIPPSEDAQIRSLLSEHQPPLSDDGFSNRVMAALPAPVTRRNTSLRAAVCALGAAAGCVVAWQGVSGFGAWDQSSQHLRTALAEAAVGMSDTRFLVAIAVTAASLAYAFKRELRNVVRM